MSTLSIRLDPELEHQLDLEVTRRKSTRSRFVQELLREALSPRDPLHLLREARAAYGLPDPSKVKAKTNKTTQVKAQVRRAVQAKHGLRA